jgi:hypothetical protein
MLLVRSYTISCVEDVLDSIKAAPRDVHRLVADNPKLYLGEIKPHLKQVLTTMKHAGKKLFFVRCVCVWLKIQRDVCLFVCLLPWVAKS